MPVVPAIESSPLVIDSDIFSDWQREAPDVRDRIRGYVRSAGGMPAVTSVTAHELYFGIWKEEVKHREDPRFRKAREQLGALLSSFVVLDFNLRAGEIAAEVFARLGKRLSNSNRNDIYIAAIAIAHGYGLATRNRRDFELIGNSLPVVNLALVVWGREQTSVRRSSREI
jgi:predicted nucleic acid-binding protein